MNLLELLVWGRKSNAWKHLIGRPRKRKYMLVISERNWVRLAGELFRELPRDEAISILNLIKKYSKGS